MKTFLLFVLLATTSALAGTDEAARGVVLRLLPKHASQFVVETIPADNGRDVFEVESKAGKIVLRGNNGVAIASGLNHYLKNFCHCDISWFGDRYRFQPVEARHVRVFAMENKP